MRTRSSLLSLLILLPLLADGPIRGFSPEQATAQAERERRLRALPEAPRIRAYLERMAAEPHAAGSAQGRAVAEYALGLFREWGLEARIETFEALLPYPTSRSLELLGPKPFKARLAEPALKEDADSSDKGQLPTYNAYSAAGDVTAPIIYANYGIPEDYEVLRQQGIDVRGKIVLTRYGRSWRGVKPKVAAENGAVACLIYSDPREDGFYRGDVYPKGAYRPADGVQRGSVMDMAIHTGDPLSPGWASEKGSRRLTMAQAKTLMKIPVLPISYADAQPLLDAMGGPVAPEAWRGALPTTYHLGPSAASVRLRLEFDNATRPIHNVIATLPGREEPDQWVLYGNHHDAWVNGASDPVSGAASLLETARSLAEMARQGWRPRRTIKLVLWDAEEFGLVGSTEWVEKHADELRAKAVAYLNSDSNGRGTIGASGMPTLEVFLAEVLREVRDPVSGKPVIEASRSRRGGRGEGEFQLGPLGSGSDYVGFSHHLGVASLNLGFGSADSGGVYHSIHDSVAWYKRFSDGEFVYGRALSQVTSTALARLADANVLPFEFTTLARRIQEYMKEVREQAGKQDGRLQWGELTAELSRLQASAAAYEKQLGASTAWHRADARRLSALNEALYRAERALTLPEGLPGREWYKHQISAPGLYTGYGAKTLPGIREAVEAGRWDEANEQARQVTRALRAFRGRIDDATKLLTGLGE